jgi:hypothetical protein
MNDLSAHIYLCHVNITAILVVNESANVNDTIAALKNIAAAHFIIVLAITGKQNIFII